MRYTVEMVLDLLSSEMTFEEIIEDYPALEINDLKACSAFAAKLAEIKVVGNVA